MKILCLSVCPSFGIVSAIFISQNFNDLLIVFNSIYSASADHLHALLSHMLHPLLHDPRVLDKVQEARV
jgi:hypothetical protein